MSGTSTVTTTVAICTRDRPELLERLLHSIAGQSREPHEVLVVDNAPATERTRELVSEKFPTCRYVREPVPGLDFARNRALREATGTVLAFIDDDAVADRDWVEATEQVFGESPRIAACMGKVDALSLEHEGARLFEANGGFARGSRRIHLPPGAGTSPAGGAEAVDRVVNQCRKRRQHGDYARAFWWNSADSTKRWTWGPHCLAVAIWTSSGGCSKPATKSCTNRASQRNMSTDAKGARPKCRFSNTTVP